MLSRLHLVVLDVASVGPDSGTPWERYEAAKRVIAASAKSAREYEVRVRKAAAELGV